MSKIPETPAELQNWLRYNEARRILREHGMPSHITLHEALIVDDYGTVTFGDWGGYLLQVAAMAFNDRLVLTPINSPWGYDHGWCYPKGGAAFLAALAWNPETEGEPVGFIKRIGSRARVAGDRSR